MDIDPASASKWLKVIAVCAQGLTSGAALYISLVEVPARMTLDMPSALRSWKPIFNRAKKSQGLISSFGILAGFGTYFLDRGTARECIGWPIASCIVLSVVPYTLIGMMPLNNELLETEQGIKKGDNWIRQSLNKWANLHCVRTVVNVGAMGVMTYCAIMCGK